MKPEAVFPHKPSAKAKQAKPIEFTKTRFVLREAGLFLLFQGSPLRAAAGARPEDIQKILGHAKFDVTANVYIHQNAETLKNAVNLIK